MQNSNNNNSVNEIYIQPQQITYQNNNEAQEDHNVSLSEHQNNLNYRQDNQRSEITYSQQNSLFNTNNLNFNKLIQIFVQMPNGRILSCDINKNEECLQQIEDQIQKKEGIPPKRYRLYQDSKLLNTISKKTIKKYSTLHLNIKCTNKIIVVYNNQRYIILVKLNDFVLKIKQQLEDNFDFPIKCQKLYFQGTQLEDQYTLFQYQIQKHPNPIVELKLQNLIYINQESKNRQFMNYLDIFQTIKNLKSLLIQKYPDLGKFHLLHNDVVLKDQFFLNMKDIKHLSILKLVEIKYLKFEIQTSTITLKIKKLDYETIYDIKKKIEQKLKYSIYTQHLFYKGEELENQKEIFECNIEENSKLYLFNNLYLLINCNFDVFPIIIIANKKVQELKQKINELNSQMLPDYFQLKYNGEILKDDIQLSYYNVQNFDYIFMEFEI
ncbi:unnamed protein product [Paramecium sonneborni]|uniref:Ubiquitin-like domain-containing protein n=1 Tax=Paramecium sonneborni TaxID=65129 RepID=A0A8S1NGN3_9CILI|nr:unnamed protein product [Paramecium sonneborni]